MADDPATPTPEPQSAHRHHRVGHTNRTRVLTIVLGFVFAAWPMAFDQLKVAPLMNPADPLRGQAAAGNLIGVSILIGATIIVIGLQLVGRPKRPWRIVITALSTVALALVLFLVYIFTQLNHYGFS